MPTDVNDPRLTTAGLLLEASVALRRRLEEAQQRHGVTTAEFDVLLRLARSSGGRLRVADLAAQAGLTTTAVAGLVDGLGERDLVRREGDAIAAITIDGGILLAGAVGSTLDVIQADLLGPLGDDAEVVEAALRRTRDHLHPFATHDTR